MIRALRPLALIGIPLLVVAGALMFWLKGGRYAATENAFVKADIAQIAGEVAGRIVEVRARDHQFVTEGEVLVRLDPEPYRLALAKADAEIDSARAIVEALKVSLRETRMDARETENRLTYFELQAKRQRELSGRGVSARPRASSRRTVRSSRRATGSACCSSASRASKPRSAEIPTRRRTSTPQSAKRSRSATAPRSIWRTPRSRRRAPGRW